MKSENTVGIFVRRNIFTKIEFLMLDQNANVSLFLVSPVYY